MALRGQGLRVVVVDWEGMRGCQVPRVSDGERFIHRRGVRMSMAASQDRADRSNVVVDI
jgi:hypothetical protein